MTDDIIPTQDELTALKARADVMGINYHPSIGLEKLREKVNAALNQDNADNQEPPTPKAAEPESKAAPESEQARRRRKRDEAAKLVRVRVTCMNPNKSAYEGEVFTVGNSVVGTYKKYVPFETEWHVPQIMLNMIQSKKVQIFVEKKDSRGNKSKVSKLVNEFAVEILPQLTPAELKDLAQRQAMAAGTGQ